MKPRENSAGKVRADSSLCIKCETNNDEIRSEQDEAVVKQRSSSSQEQGGPVQSHEFWLSLIEESKTLCVFGCVVCVVYWIFLLYVCSI